MEPVEEHAGRLGAEYTSVEETFRRTKVGSDTQPDGSYTAVSTRRKSGVGREQLRFAHNVQGRSGTEHVWRNEDLLGERLICR